MRHKMEDCIQYAPGHAGEPIADCAVIEKETPQADPLAEKLVKALEEQNELLRQLARQAA